MRTLPLTVQRACPGHSQGPAAANQSATVPRIQNGKGLLLQLTLSLFTEGHRGPVWLWLLILSVLCRFTWAFDVPGTELVECLNNPLLTSSIQSSDAKLYTPAVDEIKDNCEIWSLKCYMLELDMVLIELQIHNNDTDCITAFKNSFNPNIESCPPCEAMALQSTTAFLDNLKNLLKKLTAQYAPH